MFSREPFVSVKLVQTHRGRLSQEMKAAWSLRTLCWIYILWCNWVWLEVVVCSCSRAQQLSEPSDKPALHWQTDDEQPANSRKQPALRPWMRRRQKNYRRDQTMEDLKFYISQINIWCCLSLSWMMMIKSSWIFLSFFLKLNKEVKLLLSCYLL